MYFVPLFFKQKEVGLYAQRGQTFCVERWFSRARVLQIPSEHPASLDPQRTNIT